MPLYDLFRTIIMPVTALVALLSIVIGLGYALYGRSPHGRLATWHIAIMGFATALVAITICIGNYLNLGKPAPAYILLALLIGYVLKAIALLIMAKHVRENVVKPGIDMKREPEAR